MRLRRTVPALAMIALIVACVSGVFLLASNASAQPLAQPRGFTPSPRAVLAAPADDSTGEDAAVTGLATIAAGVVLVSVCWVWQALSRGPAQIRGRSRLDRQPRHRHE